MQNDSSENQVDIIPMILCILEKIFTYSQIFWKTKTEIKIYSHSKIWCGGKTENRNVKNWIIVFILDKSKYNEEKV